MRSEYLTGNFHRGSKGIEQNTLPDEHRLLLLRTAAGVKAILVVRIDISRNLLIYVDPTWPTREQRTSVFQIEVDHRPTLHLSAFEDMLDRSGTSGNAIGTLTLKIPGLDLGLN